MAIEETFSPLDPLGPEFGGINRPVLDEKGLQPFEGDLIRPEPINFPKVYVPNIPDPGLDVPTLNVKRNLVGKFPNKPHTSKKPTSGKDVSIATKNYLDTFFQANQDKNNYAKIYSYNPGPDGNAFYKRYAAYGQKTFDEIDFHPLRNNEANFNARTTAWDDMGRMLNHSFLPLVGLGFTSSLKSLGKMAQGDFTSADLDEAREYEEYAAIGQSSKGGFAGFFNNTLMNFGYTAGIIGEAILEEGVAAVLAPITAGGSTFAATANIASKIGKAFKGFDLMKDGYSAVRGTLNSLNNLPNARKFFDTVKAGSKTTLGRALNPLENTFGAIGDIGKLDNISSLAKISKTAGGFYRDVRNLNMAVAEARLEAGMNENKVFDNLYNDYYAKTGEGPSDDLQYQFKQQAKEASIDTFYKNAGLIYASNKITFDNITGPKGGLRSFIKNTREDILTLGAKQGEKSFGKYGKIIYDNAAKKFVLEKNNIKELAKSWYKNPGAKTLTKTAGYFKSNFTEGFQEVAQEVIAGANEKYYTDSFKSNLLQSNLFSQAVMSSTIKKQKGEYYADELGNQMSGQGFETFSSGFFMGMFAGPLNNAIPFLSSQYNRMYNKDEYVKWKDMKENTATEIISELNDISLPEMLSDRNHNLGVQDLVSKVKRSGTKKEALDAETESFVESAGIMLKYGTTDVFTQKLKDLQTATDEEFMDAVPGIEQQDIEKYKSRIDNSITRLERIQDRYKKYQDKFPNPVNETQLDPKAPDYNEKIILSRAWDRATTNAVFFNESFEDVMGRINDIQKTYVSSKSLGKANYADTMAIFKTDGMGNHLNTLESELASAKQALTKDPKRIAALTSKIDTLKSFQTSYDKFNRFFKREDYANEVAQELETKNGKEPTAEEVAEALNQKYGNLEDTSLSDPILQELKTAHHNYLKALAGEKDDFAFDEDLDKGFELLTDYYKLDQEKKQLAKYVDLLHNPQNFIDVVRKNGEWMTKMYENRSEYYHDLVYKQLGMIENNALLNALADKGFFISTEDFENYIKTGIPPKEIFNAAESRVYKEGTEEYNEVYRYYFVKRAELEEINGKSKTEIVDQAYRDKLDELDASEKEAIDKLPKTRVEEIQGEISPKGKNKSFGISEIIIEAEPGDYIRADYEDGEEPLMLYMDDQKQLRADGPEGDVLDPKTIKTKFTKAVRYTVEMQADPKEVEKIKKQFNAARAEVKKQYQNDKKLATDDKQDYTFSFEGKDINTKDLSIEDIKLFQARIADRIKVLTEEQTTLETEEQKAKNKKMLEDLNVTLTNLNKILDAKATQDYSPEQKKAIRLIQNLIEKQKNVEEGYMLTEDDEVTGLKKGDIAYRVNGQIHRRTTSATQDVIDEGYSYTGESAVTDAFEKTIGASGLNPASITLFMEEIRTVSSKIGFDPQLLTELETFLKNMEGKSKAQIDRELASDKINKQIDKINEKIELAEKDNNQTRVDNLKAQREELYPELTKLNEQTDDTTEDLDDTTLDRIMAFAKEKSFEDGRTAGNFVDDAKDYFEKGIKPEFDEKIITREAYDSLFGPEGYLTELKRKVDNRELYIVGRGLVVYDSDITRPEGSKLPGKDRIAGEIDLIVADRKGNLSIVDLKTGEPRKWNNFNKVNRTSSDNFHSKREVYTLQQAAYARMLENMLGVKAAVSLLPIERLSNKDTRQVTKAGRPNSPSIYKKLEYKKDTDGNFMRTERGELDYTVKEGETASDMLIPLYPETVADKMNDLIPLRKPTQLTKKRVKPVVLKPGEFEMEIEDWDDTGEVDLGLDVKLKPKLANTPPTPPVKLTQEEQFNELLKQIATSTDPEQFIDIIDNLDIEFTGKYSTDLFKAIDTRRKELDGELEPVVSENIIEKDDIFIAKSNIFTSETQKKPYIRQGGKVRVVSYNPETGIVTLVKDEGKRPKPFEVSLDQLNNDYMLESALASTNEPPVIKPKLTKEEEEILNGQADLVADFLKNPVQTSKAKTDADSQSEQEIEQELLDNLNCE